MPSLVMPSQNIFLTSGASKSYVYQIFPCENISFTKQNFFSKSIFLKCICKLPQMPICSSPTSSKTKCLSQSFRWTIFFHENLREQIVSISEKNHSMRKLSTHRTTIKTCSKTTFSSNRMEHRLIIKQLLKFLLNITGQ